MKNETEAEKIKYWVSFYLEMEKSYKIDLSIKLKQLVNGDFEGEEEIRELKIKAINIIINQ